MSAEVLRQAAALMRERAQAATPSPWVYQSRNFIGTPPVEVDEADWGGEGHSGLQVHTHQETRAWRNADVVHIASWHPAVALAVADWLDVAGADLWAHGPLHCAEGCAECDDELWMPHARAALAVARAYLGETQ